MRVSARAGRVVKAIEADGGTLRAAYIPVPDANPVVYVNKL